MKLYGAMKLLDENRTDVYGAELPSIGWTVRMSVKDEFGEYYHFEVFKDNKLVDESLVGGTFNGNVALDLDWQLVKQPGTVTWQEAIEAWADGKKVSYKYPDDKTMYPFQDSNQMVTVEKIKTADWYVKD